MNTSFSNCEALFGSIDQGTTSTRFIVFDSRGRIVESHQQEMHQIYPEPGYSPTNTLMMTLSWVEHDPDVLLRNVHTCIDKTVEKMLTKAIGITNQRETTVVWGKPLYNAIVWLDTRTKDLLEILVMSTSTQRADHFQSICGLPLSTYFSAIKLKWLLENVVVVREAAEKGTLQFGTVDSWLLYNLTGGLNAGVHVTDVTNASRTFLMNIHTQQWTERLLEFFSIPMSCLPRIVSSAEVYGRVSSGKLKGVPLSGCLGDQHAALLGQRCIVPGMAKNTYGTGCFMLYNTGARPVISKNGLLTTIAFKLGPDANTIFALEGSIGIAGAGVKWLQDNLGIISEPSEVSLFASQVSDCGGVIFVPAFGGLFAPYWKPNAKACILGMTQYTTKHHICRALLEAICYQTKEVLDAMDADSGGTLFTLRVDGGITNSDLCMQLQSNIIGITVERPMMKELSALGAALAGAIGVGILDRIEDFEPCDRVDVFTGLPGTVHMKEKYAEWKKAVQKSFD